MYTVYTNLEIVERKGRIYCKSTHYNGYITFKTLESSGYTYGYKSREQIVQSYQ